MKRGSTALIFASALLLVAATPVLRVLDHPAKNGLRPFSATLSAALVAERNPTVTDDTTKGYAANEHWVNTLTGALYKAASVGSGTAVWNTVSAPSLPLDAVGSAAAAYGSVRLRAAYAGNAFKVIRASDSTTLDIGFDGNGVADFAAMDAFGSGTTVKLHTLYDQSGNSLDATSDSSRPAQSMTANYVGAIRSLEFPGTQYMILPAGLSLPRNGFSAVMAVSQTSGYYGTIATLGTTQFLFGWTNNGGFGAYNGAQDHSHLTIEHTGDSVASVVDDGSNMIFAVGNKLYTDPFPGSAVTMTGGYVPRSTGTGRFRLGALIFYPSALSAADVLLARNALNVRFRIPLQVKDRIVYIGDSITAAYNAADAVGYAAIASRSHTVRSYVQVNTGVPAQLQADESAASYTPFVVTGARNVAHIFSGTNDIAANASGASVVTTTATLYAALKAGGFNEVIIGTMLPRTAGFTNGQTSGGFETQRQAYNTAIRATYPSREIADYGGHPIIGAAGASADTSLYADGIHPTKLGHTYLATIEAAGVNGL